jgi:release factor glutamine methyltransferase
MSIFSDGSGMSCILKRDYPLTSEQMHVFNDMLERRLAGEPVQYITGTRYFMGLPFYVDPRVLIPRWETELLTEYVLENCEEKKLQPAAVLDLGTGSGAIAVSLAVNLPESGYHSSGYSGKCTFRLQEKMQKTNEVFHRINFYWGDLFLSLDSAQFRNILI